MQTEIAIIGGGLSGLSLAAALVRAGRQCAVLEARARPGGRVHAQMIAGLGPFDLGPAWIWPQNRRMLSLVDRLGLTTFEQHATGNLVFEEPSGVIRRDLDFAPMAGALRVRDGLGTLIQGLLTELPDGVLKLGHRVAQIEHGGHVRLTGQGPEGPFAVQAQQLVLALPPRVIAETIRVTPELPWEARAAMKAVPTWMAGHAKVVAVYDTPFWRADRLSGEGMSHRGPMAEVHDASPAQGGGALFGFVATPATARHGHEDALKSAAVDQLTRMFGPHAANPRAVVLADWSVDVETATEADWTSPPAHPAYGMPPALARLGDQGIHVAGTEVARTEGGFLEGALEAAEAVAARLNP